MLRPARNPRIRLSKARFAIIASEYNARYVGGMLRAAEQVIRASGAHALEIVRVPGAFEIPAVAARLAARRPPFAALICLGVILRGETAHAQNIAEAVSHGLVTIQVAYGLPVIHEVLLLENEEQAARRCLDERHNRGAEAAQTALAMAAVIRRLQRKT